MPPTYYLTTLEEQEAHPVAFSDLGLTPIVRVSPDQLWFPAQQVDLQALARRVQAGCPGVKPHISFWCFSNIDVKRNPMEASDQIWAGFIQQLGWLVTGADPGWLGGVWWDWEYRVWTDTPQMTDRGRRAAAACPAMVHGAYGPLQWVVETNSRNRICDRQEGFFRFMHGWGLQQ